MKASHCQYKPELLINVPLGMHHCPECGEMVVAGFAHPGIMEESDWEEFERKNNVNHDNDEFLIWLEQIKWLLPPSMTIEETRKLYEQKVKEENELNDNQ